MTRFSLVYSDSHMRCSKARREKPRSVLSPICTFAALWLLCGKVREEAIKSLKKE